MTDPVSHLKKWETPGLVLTPGSTDVLGEKPKNSTSDEGKCLPIIDLGVEFEDLKKALDETSLDTATVVKSHAKKVYSSVDIVNSLLMVEGVDANATVHSELSDNDMSDFDEGYEAIPRRPMTIEEKEEVETQMKAASYHQDSDDVVLSHTWSFWIDKNVKKGVSEESFMDSLHQLGTFTTSHEFASLMLKYSDELINIHNQSEKCNIRLFKEGILPTREDPVNKTGGQYVVFLPKDRSEVKRLWLDFMISCIGDNLQLRGSINGLVLAMKKRGDTVAVWIDRGCHPSFYTEQKNNITMATNMDSSTRIKYNNHFMHSRQNSNSSQLGLNGGGSKGSSPFNSPQPRRKSYENNLGGIPVPVRSSSPMTFRQTSFEPASRADKNGQGFANGLRSPQPSRTSRQTSYDPDRRGLKNTTHSPQARTTDFKRNTSYDPDGARRFSDKSPIRFSESHGNRSPSAYRPPSAKNSIDDGRAFKFENTSGPPSSQGTGSRSPRVARQPSSEPPRNKLSSDWRSPNTKRGSTTGFQAMSPNPSPRGSFDETFKQRPKCNSQSAKLDPGK
eukprot:CFRG6052T1